MKEKLKLIKQTITQYCKYDPLVDIGLFTNWYSYVYTDTVTKGRNHGRYCTTQTNVSRIV